MACGMLECLHGKLKADNDAGQTIVMVHTRRIAMPLALIQTFPISSVPLGRMLCSMT